MKRKTCYAVAALTAIVILVLIGCWMSSRSARKRVDRLLEGTGIVSGGYILSVKTLTKGEILELYDIECREQRRLWVDQVFRSLTRGRLGFFRPSYARLKIVYAGKSAVLKPLLEVACDDGADLNARYWALRILLFFNDPKVLDAWVKFAEVNPRASGLFLLLLPIPMDSPYCKPGTGAATLKKDMQGKVFDQFVLELLDARVKDAKLNPFDEQILRFLNRYYGYDFDTSLRTSAPMAFEFRKAELRKGYDPLVLYGQLVRSSAVPVVFDEAGLESILPDMVDRISCEQLFNCYYEARGRTSGFPAESDWQPRLVEWYTRARPCLKYDPESGMFVNTASDAGSNGESTGEVDNETTAPYEGPERGEAADQ